MKKARQEAKRKDLELFENKPCLESLFLKILGNKTSTKDSNWCKREFETKYIDKKKRRDVNDYQKLFSKDLLDDRRKQIPELERLLRVIEAKQIIASRHIKKLNL